MGIFKTLSAAIALVSISACGVNATQGVVKPPSQTSGPFGMITHEEIKTEGDKAFTAVNKAVIGGFKVGLITAKEEPAAESSAVAPAQRSKCRG